MKSSATTVVRHDRSDVDSAFQSELTPQDQLLVEKAKSKKFTISDLLALLVERKSLRKSKRELDSLKKALDANPTLRNALTLAQCRELLQSSVSIRPKSRKHLSDEERQKGAIERNSGENELRPSSEE
jgi:hypothetical protein